MTPNGAGYVTTRSVIRQSPLSDAPDVPRGASGHVEDEADNLVWVDFDEPYGVVACAVEELR